MAKVEKPMVEAPKAMKPMVEAPKAMKPTAKSNPIHRLGAYAHPKKKGK